MGRTSSFLLAAPSSSAGNSTPWSNDRHRSAASGSSNSAKPNPWGLFAGVMSRLNDLTGPHAYRQVLVQGNVQGDEYSPTAIRSKTCQ